MITIRTINISVKNKTGMKRKFLGKKIHIECEEYFTWKRKNHLHLYSYLFNDLVLCFKAVCLD